MAKTLDSDMTAHIVRDVLTLSTCWHITRTDGVELFFTDHDVNIVFGGKTYVAATGIARTAVESKGDMSVDNLDIIGVLSQLLTVTDLKAGFYDFAEIDIFSVNWQDPDKFGSIQHRFGTLGEVQAQTGGYKAEMRGFMQVLERRRGHVYTPDCRTNLFSPLIDPISGRANGCGLTSTSFEEFGEVLTVTSDREVVVNEFSRLRVSPKYAGAFGEVVGVHEVDGVVEMVLTIADSTPMRPTVITDRTGLEAIDDDMNGYYVLGNDIDLTLTAWTPLGTQTNPFRGTFDGKGYVIRNLSVTATDPEGAGLFGANAGLIRRVGVEGGSVASGAATSWAGALCGLLMGERATQYPEAGGGQIEGCWATGITVVTDNDFAGGLVGVHLRGAIIRECWVAAVISGTVGTDVGAIVGRSTAADRVLDEVYANTDAAGTTDLGNISGGGANALVDATWGVAGSFSGFDFNDREILNVVTSKSVTAAFVESGPDTITRAAGDWVADGVRP